MRGTRWSFPWILAGLAACGGPTPAGRSPPPTVAGQSPHALGSSAPEDAAVGEIVSRYKTSLGERLAVRIGTAAADISPAGEPSNALGILVAEQMLAHLKGPAGAVVDAFVTNDGGLRAPIYAGPIELKTIFEVMPFDNELVIVEVDGAALQRIADRIATKNGEPVAGMRMIIDPAGGRATEVEVGGRPLDPAATYHVGTTDYLADAGWLSELVAKRPLAHTGILMRDAIIAQLKARPADAPPLAPEVDDRIRWAGGAPPSAAPKSPGEMK